MQSKEQLIESFTKRSRFPETPLYLAVQDAFDLIAACEENNLAVLGFDTVWRQGEAVTTLLDFILDCSSGPPQPTWTEQKELCRGGAITFLQKLAALDRDDLLVLPELMSEDEWLKWKNSS